MTPHSDLLTDSTVSGTDYVVKAFRDDSGPARTFGAHMTCVVGSENKHSVKRKNYLMTLLVHVLMVELLLQAISQNNGVTFEPIFFLTGIVKYPCYSPSPKNLLPVFVVLGNHV